MSEAIIKIRRDGPNGPEWRNPLPEEVPDAISELAYRIAELRADNLPETFEEFKGRVSDLIAAVVAGKA